MKKIACLVLLCAANMSMIAQNYSHSLDEYSSMLLQGVELNEEEKDACEFILAKVKAYDLELHNNRIKRDDAIKNMSFFNAILSRLQRLFADFSVDRKATTNISQEIGHKIEDGISFGVERCNKLVQGRVRCNNYAKELISYAEKRSGLEPSDFFDFSVDVGPHDTKRTEVLPLIDQCEKDAGEEGFSVRFSENFKQK